MSCLSTKEQIKRFSDFLNIRSVSSEGPNGSYQECVDFIEKFCAKFDLEFDSICPVENKPIAIVKYAGTDETLPSILLNCHYDVVPAVPEFWNTDPFNTTVTDDGRIYARGTQDMKCVCVQYLEALAILKQKGFKPLRTIYATFLPDEEIGGVEGAGKLVETQMFKDLNVGLCLDEGLANPKNKFTIFYGERRPFWFSVKSTGPTGHGSRFIKNTAMEKLMRVIRKIYEFRDEQESILGDVGEGGTEGCKHALAKKLGDVATINLTALEGGVKGSEIMGGYALNVIPTNARAGFDMRVPPTISAIELETIMNKWIEEEEGVSFDLHIQTKGIYVTSTDEKENSWFSLLSKTLREFVPDLDVEIFPAATDCRYFREIGIPSFGFSPMNNSPILLHEHNEYIDEPVYLKGIEVYCKLIPQLANASD